MSGSHDAKRRTWAVEGKCTRCGGTPEIGKKKCAPCGKRARRHSSERSARLRGEAVCRYCAKEPHLPDRTVCGGCYLKTFAATKLGSVNEAESLLRIFRRHDGRCPYTGRELVIGGNAELDHITPKSRGGESVEANYQWVYEAVNRLKVDLDDAQFRQTISLIANHIRNTSPR